MATQDVLAIFAQQRSIVLVLSLAAMAGCKSSHSTTGASPTPGGANGAGLRSSAAKLDELMSVSKLLAAYQDNAQQADAALKGKRIRIWGKATDVTRDASGSLSVAVGTGAKTEALQAQCLFAVDGHSEAALTRGADVTVDCTCAGLATNVLMKDCAIPHCSMPICETLQASGVAGDCKPATKDWSDSANFRMPSVVTKTGFGGGYVECEPNDKVYYFMLNDLRAHARANQLVFASPKARVVVSLASDDPIPPDIETKTRALVDGL